MTEVKQKKKERKLNVNSKESNALLSLMMQQIMNMQSIKLTSII